MTKVNQFKRSPHYIGHVKTSSGICGQGRPRLACASTQSDQVLHCPLTEPLDTMECMNGEQSPQSSRLGTFFQSNSEVLLMSTHKICFRGEIRKIFT